MIVDIFAASSIFDLVIFTVYAYTQSLFNSLGIISFKFLKKEETKNDGRSTKIERIEKCLSQDVSVNLWELRELALSDGGLLGAKYRQKSWPMLVGLTENDRIPELRSRLTDDSESKLELNSKKKVETETKANYDLIRQDAGRSVIFKFNEIETSNDSIHEYASTVPPYASERLARVLENTVLLRQGNMHYYQGLHDIAGVILHHMDYDVNVTTSIMKQISRSHLRDAMRENFTKINWLLSVLLPALVEIIDPVVHYSLQMAQVDLATICLPWIITWYTHDVHDPETAGRLIDAFLSGHPSMPIYFAVALITHPMLKKDILETDSEDPTSFFLLIKTLPLKIKSKQKENDRYQKEQQITVPLQEVLEDSISTMKRIPPRSLLDLVDSKTHTRKDLLQRISSISLFKATASWSMAGGLPTSWQELNDMEGTMYCRAKISSGVPMLINTVSDSSLLSRKSWGSRKCIKKKKTLKIRKLTRIILGKPRNKSF